MAVVKIDSISDSRKSDESVSKESFFEEFTKSGLTDPPVDVISVAEMLGIQVSYELMEKDLSGYLEFKGGRWVAGINLLHHPNRQRFTLAHEIAHFVLHTDEKARFVDETYARRNANSDPMENEADSFAARILMPEAAVRQTVNNGLRKVSRLADHFGVSAQAMRIQLINLGYNVG